MQALLRNFKVVADDQANPEPNLIGFESANQLWLPSFCWLCRDLLLVPLCDRLEGLDLFTVNAAKQERVANKVGRVEVGMLADVIVVDQNPYEVPIARVHDTKVRMTFIEGEKVFDEASPPKSMAH